MTPGGPPRDGPPDGPPEPGGAGAPAQLIAILNLSRYHREHEKFYARSPLERAIDLQRAARTLTTLADRWSEVAPTGAPPTGVPFAGCEDLNEPAAIQSDGVLFMEGEGEPVELVEAEARSRRPGRRPRGHRRVARRGDGGLVGGGRPAASTRGLPTCSVSDIGSSPTIGRRPA